MATSSRQAALFGVNDWKAIYQTFREADFLSYDYETLRKSFIDYLRVYYPETFNDYIESSEYIALLDVMAFMGQGLAFRNDLNSRENFLDTAERRDSVIKLANLVSYTPKRNLCSEGYLKITSISTTQNVLDLNGTNLSNVPVLWNDPANIFFLEQFNAIINAALIDTQKIGRPGNVSDILGVVTSEYSIKIPTNTLPIAPFQTSIDGTTMSFELVSVSSVGKDYLYEIPPSPSGRFNLCYRNDQLGYGSGDTGFFFYFKQGILQNVDFNFTQQISNQVIDINIEGINNTDTWLYQLSTDNNTRILWRQVDSVYANAYLQTEGSNREIFSVNSRFNDQVTYVFGDGVFSKIPVGAFRAYVRAGNGLTYTIDPSEMQGISVSFNYISRVGKIETLTVGLTLTNPVSNAQARETLPDIKQRAPTRYYTQNRMVNGEDYNNFPYTLYSSIIKSKAVNRSSVGVSKNLDLLDPTGKYSSINSFGSDGALYQTDIDGFLNLTIVDQSDIIEFLSVDLATVLASNKANQYYIQNYERYNLDATSGDGTVYWHSSTVDANSQTGYFYNINLNNDVPLAIGLFNSNNAKYITQGALVQFTAPIGFYFNDKNRLVSGIPGPNNPTSIWTTVLNINGDGNNNGQGNFANGTGPVTLNGFIPQGAICTQVIPVFENKLNTIIVNECVDRMELQLSFSLVFNNSLAIDQQRWSIRPYEDPDYFVNFLSLGNNRYSVTYKSLTYYFGSVEDIRFAFSTGELVYDPFSGKILQDYINILSINTVPYSNTSLSRDIKVNIVGQTVESDGYINDFEVEVSGTDVNNKTLILNPDFFETVTGVQTDAANIGKYVFFVTIQDPINLTREQIVPTSEVEYQYSNKNQIEVVKYDYPLGQLFYAYAEIDSYEKYNVFYKTVQDPTVTTPSYSLVLQPLYTMKPGRQGLSFQYRHNSNNTTRIDPATTNIIDLYVVTQSYYTAYNNWLVDTTNTVPYPDKPTTTELNIAYGKINDYKMLSDSVILNCVTFKPLFGIKADAALRGTIKVIKNADTSASDSEIRSAVLTAMNNYFNINNWNFGETFYFSELSAYLHNECGDLINSAVLVPNNPEAQFGDLYEIKSAPYEIFVNAATSNDVVVIAALTPAELQER